MMGGDKGESGIIKWLTTRYLSFIVITFLYLAIRYIVLGAFGPAEKPLFCTRYWPV